MSVNRRRLLQAAALSGLPISAQESPLGPALSEERRRLLAPILARRKAQWQSLRDFVIDDQIAPTQGIPDGNE